MIAPCFILSESGMFTFVTDLLVLVLRYLKAAYYRQMAGCQDFSDIQGGLEVDLG
jgi:hypothetical protein